jgi:hypothetical protein
VRSVLPLSNPESNVSKPVYKKRRLPTKCHEVPMVRIEDDKWRIRKHQMKVRKMCSMLSKGNLSFKGTVLQVLQKSKTEDQF